MGPEKQISVMLKNKNRGYIKLDVWKKAIELFQLIWKTVHVDNKIDYKLRSQIVNSAQSVSSNIAEGYSRRTVHDYIRFLYIALSSLSETLTRAIGLQVTNQITVPQFHQIDKLHYEVENKMLRLIESIEEKRDSGKWTDHIGKK